MTYRVWCEYRPDFRRANGGTARGPKRGRGAWIVRGVTKVHDETRPLQSSGWFPTCLGVLSPSSPQAGTRVSPRKLLDEHLEQRRLVRFVNRYGKAANA